MTASVRTGKSLAVREGIGMRGRTRAYVRQGWQAGLGAGSAIRIDECTDTLLHSSVSPDPEPEAKFADIRP